MWCVKGVCTESTEERVRELYSLLVAEYSEMEIIDNLGINEYLLKRDLNKRLYQVYSHIDREVLHDLVRGMKVRNLIRSLDSFMAGKSVWAGLMDDLMNLLVIQLKENNRHLNTLDLIELVCYEGWVDNRYSFGQKFSTVKRLVSDRYRIRDIGYQYDKKHTDFNDYLKKRIIRIEHTN